MPKSLMEMAADIVAAQAAHEYMSLEELEAALTKTFKALQRIKSQEEGVAEAPVTQPEMDAKRSIQQNKVICLECAREFKQLTSRHLKEHGLTAREYRLKHGFSARQSLTAKTLTAKRRKTAKELGLGERLQAARKEKAREKKKRPPRRKKVRIPPAAEQTFRFFIQR
jgi:predicted transcriptional regulator